MHRFFSFLLFYSVLNGCAYDHADVRSPDTEKPTAIKNQTYVYECPDGFGFVARTEADSAWLFLPGNTIELPQIKSSSGAKYSKGGYLFQVEGDKAMIVSSTGKHTDCRNNRSKAIWERAKLNGVDFRATGNEPGWYLEISNKTDILLVADYGEHTYQFKSSKIQSEAHNRTTVYNANNNGDTIEVVITGTACQDSMSGERFSTKVSVLVNDKRYDGCGKALH
jgi:putative lipoprotein